VKRPFADGRLNGSTASWLELPPTVGILDSFVTQKLRDFKRFELVSTSHHHHIGYHYHCNHHFKMHPKLVTELNIKCQHPMHYSAYSSSNNLAPSCTLFALFSMRYISNYKQNETHTTTLSK